MMTMTRRTALGGLSALISAPLFAQPSWPNRPLTLVVGFPAGGPVDTVSRIVGERLSRRLRQPIVVEDKPGATGTIAAAQVAHAAPDGYTLTMLPGTFAASAAMFRKLPYHPVNDFSWISTIAAFPYLLATYSARGSLRIRQKQSSALAFGTSGVGSVQHLSGELTKYANIKQRVPHRVRPGISNLLGSVPTFCYQAWLFGFIRDGDCARWRSPVRRFFGLPDIVTVSSRIPGYNVTSWQDLLAAPAGLAAAILDRLPIRSWPGSRRTAVR